MKSAPYSGHGVTARKGQTLARTLEGGTYNLVVDHGAADGWYFLSLAGKELVGGMGWVEEVWGCVSKQVVVLRSLYPKP